MLPAELARLVHVVADARETFEVVLDVGACFLAFDPELYGEAESRNSIDDAEVDRCCAAAHFSRHVLDWDAEHFRSGHGVNVDTILKRFSQSWNIGDFRKQPQFDLRIVG